MSEQMTPAEAAGILEYLYDPDFVGAYAVVALRTIAADRLEYGVLVDYERYGEGSGMWWDEESGEEWGSLEWAKELLAELRAEPLREGELPAELHLMARRVSEPWEAKDE